MRSFVGSLDKINRFGFESITKTKPILLLAPFKRHQRDEKRREEKETCFDRLNYTNGKAIFVYWFLFLLANLHLRAIFPTYSSHTQTHIYTSFVQSFDTASSIEKSELDTLRVQFYF